MTLNDVPLASQTLGLTQPLIRSNFDSIDMAFAVDHVGYNLTNAGKHARVTLPVLPAPSFVATEGGMYNALDSFSGTNQIFIHTPTGALNVPMTAASLTSNGYSYLPSGLLMQWGFQVNIPLGTNSIVFSKVFPNAVLNIMVSPVSVNTPVVNFLSVNSANLTTSGFQILNGNTTQNPTANWFAIGN